MILYKLLLTQQHTFYVVIATCIGNKFTKKFIKFYLKPIFFTHYIAH